ncbi:AAA family ATPase [Aliidiomarina sp. Khilg15.8]
MKILKLRLSNLNSLVGEWEIDFTDPAYVNDGIFAITGPTGAGKSTLLDAMCLALYGATPRLGKVTKSENELMSRHTGECFAELTFTTGTGIFRCHWYQHRGRRKATNPLQTQRHELVDASTGKILEAKVSSVPDAVEQLTGLDFTRFTRSMLLAQGEFAAFLHATDNDRSAILEQITGTAIYAELSKATYARYKDEGLKLTQLRSELEQVDLLDAEALQNLQQRHRELVTASTKTEAALDAARESQQWVERLQELNLAGDQLVQAEKSLQQDLSAFEPQQLRLSADAKARPLSADFRELTVQQKRVAETGEALRRLASDMPQALTKQQEAERLAGEQEKASHAARDQQRAWQPKIKEARALDVELRTLRAQRDKLATELGASQSQYQTEQQRQQTLHEQIDSLQVALKSSHEWQREHAALADLAADIPVIDNKLHQLQRIHVQLEDNQQEQASVEAAGNKLAAMPLADAHDRDLAQAEEKLRAANELLQSRQETARLAAAVASLEDERARLQRGEPCPLCGATEHPFVDHDEKPPAAQATAVEQARKAYDQALHDVQQLRVQQAISGSERESEQRRLQEQQAALQQVAQALTSEGESLRLQLTEKLSSYGMDVPALDKLDSFLRRLDERAQTWQSADKKRQQQERELSEMQVRADSQQQLVTQAQAQVTKLRDQHAAIETEYNAQLQAREAALQEADVDAFEARLEKSVQAANERFEKARDAWREAQQQVQRMKHEQSRLEAAEASETATLNRLQDDFTQALTRNGFTDLDAFQKALLSDSERTELERQNKALEQRRSEINASKESHAKALKKAQDKQPEDPSALLEELNQLREQSAELQREQGAIEQTLRKQEELSAAALQKQQQVQQQLREYDRWSRLNDLIGSADGKRYRNFAQGLTFEVMIEFANQKLAKMTDRYLLQRDADEPLQLNVIDDYQAGEVRSTKNLSGGESFIVSLALALGLSQMSSHKVRVDSLFLDEGFGTLDEAALDVALDTLSSLQQDGKVIGVISHVAALKERIATQIQVHSGTGGRSSLQGPGVMKISETMS